MNNISKVLIRTFRKFKQSQLNVHEPDLYSSDIKTLKKCIDTKNVSAAGTFCRDFENEIKKITKSKYVVLTNSGTSALHISCLLTGINNKHEVLMPAFTFAACPNAVIYCNAHPHFVEIEEKNFGIDFKKLSKYLKNNTIRKNNLLINKKTKKIIKAIIVVHPIGYPVNYDHLKKFKKEFNLDIIEDAADALGSYYGKTHVGLFGTFGVLSFNGNKIITTGAGGAILTQNKILAKKAKKLVETSKINHNYRFIHDQLGFNYRMSNLQAGLGLTQIKRFKKILKKKRLLNKFYNNQFQNTEYFKIINEPKNKKFNFWLQTIVIKKRYLKYINSTLESLRKKNFLLRVGWDLMPNLKYLRKYPCMKINIAKDIQKRIIHLPSSSFLIK